MEVHAHLAHRQVRLRGQDEDEQRHPEVHAAFDEAQADGHRDDRHRQGREQLQHQRRQERHPQHPHGRGPVPVPRVPQLVGLRRGPPEDPQGRQPGDEVEEEPGQLGQPPPLALHRHGGVLPDEDHEHRDQRQRHGQDHRGEHVLREDREPDGQRHDDRQHELRQVASEVGVERIDPAAGQCCELAGVRTGQPLRPDPKGLGDHRHPQLALHLRRRPERGRLGAVRHQAPGRRDRDQAEQRPGDVVHPGALSEDLVHRAAEQEGRCDDQDRLQHPGSHGGRQEPACRRRPAQQAGVERLHGVPGRQMCGRFRIGGAGSGAGRASTRRAGPPEGPAGAVTAPVSPVRRLRLVRVVQRTLIGVGDLRGETRLRNTQ